MPPPMHASAHNMNIMNTFLQRLTTFWTVCVLRMLFADQNVAGSHHQFIVGSPAPPQTPMLPPQPAPPPLQLPYVDQTVPHFTQIPQMFHLYYQGEYRPTGIYRMYLKFLNWEPWGISTVLVFVIPRGGSVPQATRQQRASHQTVDFLFLTGARMILNFLFW